MAYVPMTNERRDFDPMSTEWNYISDEYPGQEWRGLVPVNLRPFTWPYRLRTDRNGRNAYGSVRLAPNWAYYAWRNELVGASWEPSSPHTVNCRMTLERRYAPAGEVSDWPANPFAGEGNDRWHVYEWTARVDLNLLDGSFALTVRGRGEETVRPPHVPADVYAEAQHKAEKLLAFFRAECEHWKAGDQERPVQARDLYEAQKAAQSLPTRRNPAASRQCASPRNTADRHRAAPGRPQDRRFIRRTARCGDSGGGTAACGTHGLKEIAGGGLLALVPLLGVRYRGGVYVPRPRRRCRRNGALWCRTSPTTGAARRKRRDRELRLMRSPAGAANPRTTSQKEAPIAMQATVSRTDLAAAFAWTADALPKRPALPVLTGMQLTVEDQTLTLAAFDYEQARRGWVTSSRGEHQAGQVLVDGKALEAAIGTLPKATKARPVAVQLTACGDTLTVSAQGSTWTLPAMPVKDYPTLPGLPPVAGVIDGVQFARSVTRVGAAAGRDETLPVLTGIHFVTHAEALGLTATDRYRLAHDRLFWTPADPEMPSTEFTVQAGAIAAFAKKAGKSGKVTVHFGETASGYPVERAGFRDDARELIITPLTGTFPRTQSMLRPESPVNLTVDAVALIGALKRMNVITASGLDRATREGLVDLRYSAGEVTVYALDKDLLTPAATERVPAEADFPDFVVRFCAPYLWSLLDGIDGKAVIGLAAGNAKGGLAAAPDLRKHPKPATVRPADGGTFQGLIMPPEAS